MDSRDSNPNLRQRLFIEFYLGASSGNATDAARRAGYRGTDGSLRVTGSRLLTKANIQRRIRERVQEVAMDADEVLQRLAEQARGSVFDFMELDEDGSGYHIQLTKGASEPAKRHIIKRLRQTRDGIDIQLVDSQQALITLARHHGLLQDKVSIEVARERLKGLIEDDPVQ